MSRLAAIGDIHGDHDRFLELLVQHNFTTTNGNWIAGSDTLVCTGDLTDRGTQDLEVLRLCEDLQIQAQQAGGDFISLMGNHDAMFISIALDYSNKTVPSTGNSYFFRINGGNQQAAENCPNHLLKWLQDRPAMVKIGNTLFQHCDSARLYLQLGGDIEIVNNYFKIASTKSDSAWDLFEIMTDGRLWGYGSRQIPDYLPSLDNYFEEMACDIIVHGHTRHKLPNALTYYNGKIINVDGSLSNGYGNNPDRGFIHFLDN